ncbi:MULTISPECIES: phage tail protein [Pandoraea]|uniref:phage tail protein n=1 Tax=Pandoraea TaxID=93217 RepID=UPI001F5C3B1B|nr:MULTISPECIES: phage tail protein [Pandoraea]MCI3205835.1 phage tail protein [Pandoraea sp. LA3]MDN4583863.1 phage tail protein [Pandoraea capi]
MELKTVYQTDERGLFLYPTTAHELYLSPGEYNIPFGAVEAEPPVTEDGTVQKWIEGAWTVVEDNRHKRLYVARSAEEYQLGATIEINGESVTYHGDGPIPEWLTDTRPVVDVP